MPKLFFIYFFVGMFSTSAQVESKWETLLQKYVTAEGLVNYKALLKERKPLDDYASYLAKQNPENWSKQEKLAFYINAYNAFTLQLVLDNYPVESIKNIGGFLDGPFSKTIFLLAGEKVSLNDIEKRILIPMNEPKIHFAINCASKSCPKLSNQLYKATRIEKQLDQAATDFINSNNNKITQDNLALSKIFDWYKKDFTTNTKTIINYLNQYSFIKIELGTKISYLEYDWSLNELK